MKKVLSGLVFFVVLFGLLSFENKSINDDLFKGYVVEVEKENGVSEYYLDVSDFTDDENEEETQYLINLDENGKKLAKHVDERVEVKGKVTKNKDKKSVLNVSSFKVIVEEDE